MTSPQERTGSTTTLADGRRLGYAEWGAETSETVVLDFHGGPGCRLSVSGDRSVIARSGVRWVTLDRPGLGLSWPQPGRSVADFAADVSHLADHLGVDRFHVLGWSMGGPYAAACGALLPHRVRSVTLFAPAPIGLGEPQGAEHMGKAFAWILARDDPWQMCQLFTTLGLEARRNPPLAVSLFTDGGDALSPSEAALLADPTLQQDFVEIIVESTRQGAAGLVEDMRVELAPWGFDPASVGVPISLWQGDDDSFVGIDSAHAWTAAVPSLELRLLPGDGHMFPFERTAELLALL